MASQIQTVGVLTEGGGALYSRSYDASIRVIKNIVPFVNADDEVERLKSSVTAVPRLIAVGLMENLPGERKEQALCEAALCCREAVVMLSYCRDLHGRFVNGMLCANLIDTYRDVGTELDLLLKAPQGDGGEA